MSEQELREIDRRVALALGWTWYPGGEEIRTKDGLLYGTTDAMWLLPDGTSAMCSALFTADPAAADLVLHAIEKRFWVWVWFVAMYCGERTSWACELTGGNFTVEEHSEAGRYVALCLAFLAAVEAEKGAPDATG